MSFPDEPVPWRLERAHCAHEQPQFTQRAYPEAGLQIKQILIDRWPDEDMRYRVFRPAWQGSLH